MDVLYIVGKGSRWNNNELKYSLRSLERYCSNVGRVYVCGFKPNWLVNVTHIPCSDKYPYKHANMMYKILSAIAYSDIDRNFLVSSDDHFFCKKCDLDDYPLFYHGDMLPDSMPGCNPKSRGYYRSLVNTKRFLDGHGLPTYNFSQHCNMLFDKHLLASNYQLAMETLNIAHGIESYSFMGNLIVKNTDKTPVARKDKKLRGIFNKEDFQRVVGDDFIWSMADSEIGGFCTEYLQNEFNEKSEYEK